MAVSAIGPLGVEVGKYDKLYASYPANPFGAYLSILVPLYLKLATLQLLSFLQSISVAKRLSIHGLPEITPLVLACNASDCRLRPREIALPDAAYILLLQTTRT
jgi:hypothetical protein